VLLGQSGSAGRKGGATFISPFIGRHDDNGFDGLDLIRDIRLIYDNYNYATEILAASIRHGVHVLECARIGADVMTAPPAVIKGLVKHVLTDKGIEGFMADWAKTGQSL
jgi:transaldolase